MKPIKVKDLLSTRKVIDLKYLDLIFIGTEAEDIYRCDDPEDNYGYVFNVWLPSNILNLTAQELLTYISLGVVVLADPGTVSATLDDFLEYLKTTLSNE